MNGLVVQRDDGPDSKEKFSNKNTKERDRERDVCFIHHLGGRLLRLDDLQTWATEEDDDIEVFSMKGWVARADTLGMYPAVAAMLAGFGSETVMAFPAFLKDLPTENSPYGHSIGS
ncbi:hypothetical protein F4825DRAFT_330763 [Nemania diffusa]|nr:hypothetical protein F4825DRAFT_330763 [Nemania diffusa]